MSRRTSRTKKKQRSMTNVTGVNDDALMLNIKLPLPENADNDLNPESCQVICEAVAELVANLMSAACEEEEITLGYNPETGKYHLGDEIVDEGESYWMAIKKMSGEKACSANLDEMDFQPEPINSNRVPKRLEKAYLKARYKAFSQKEPGSIIICQDGKMWTPCQIFTNPYTLENDYIICVYNAEPCLDVHRHFYCRIDAEIGNLGFETPIRFVGGHEIDWGRRFEDEITLARREPGLERYDPFLDPNSPQNVCESNGGWYFSSFME